MNAALGTIGVWLAFAAAIVGAGDRRARRSRTRRRGRAPDPRLDGRLLAPVLLVGMVVAVAAMEHALVTHDFTIAFVADNNSRATPLIYSITGLWSALSGSILLWGFLLSVFVCAVVWRFRADADDRRRGLGDPRHVRRRRVLHRTDGRSGQPVPARARSAAGPGGRARTRSSRTTRSSPSTRRCSTSASSGSRVPFAFTIGMLATGRVGDRWQVETRRWTLIAWTFLSVGIVLGAWWSYQVLGWGGFWAWDPVENAALLPWLCGTAYLHSVLVQERRGLLRVWNLSLSVATFSLTILGTFLTRSGVIESVHAFSDSTLGPVLISFFLLVVVVGFGLIAWRGDRIRSPGGIDAPLGREGAFLLNNLLFVGFAFVVLLGTAVPAPLPGDQEPAGDRRARRTSTPWPCRSAWRSWSSWPSRRRCPGARCTRACCGAGSPRPRGRRCSRSSAAWPAGSGGSSRCSPSAWGRSRGPRRVRSIVLAVIASVRHGRGVLRGIAGPGQRRDGRPPRRGRDRGGHHGRHLVRAPGRARARPGAAGHLRRPHLRVRGPSDGALPLADGHRGRSSRWTGAGSSIRP